MKKFIAALFVFLALYSLSHAKIEPQLRSKLVTFSPSEEISVIVFMKDKPAISALSGTRGDKISALNRFSERSQRGISELLTRKKQRDNKISFSRFWTFNGLGLKAPKDVIEEIAARDDVEKVIINRTFRLPPRPKEITGLSSIKPLSTAVEDNIAQIRADKVWDELGFRGNGVKVGIADTGVRATHVDLAGKIPLQATFDLDGNMTDAAAAPDNDGHGTHVAGIVAGGNSSIKYIGVAPSASLLVAKVFNNDPNPSASELSVAAGGEWLIANGAGIINLSLGGAAGEAVSFFKTLVDAWEQDFDILVVAAIGNDGPGPGTSSSPGNVPNALGIGSVDISDDISSFSSRGPVYWSGTPYYKPEITAPGSSIRSAAYTGNNSYVLESGTSMACPHAAGVAALMLEANPTLTPSDIRERLKNTAFRKDGVDYPNNSYGWGRIDALAALSSVPPTIETPSYAPIPARFAENIVVSADIYFSVSGASSAVLHYRNDTEAWLNSPMTKEAGSNLYKGIVPAADAISSLDFYIVATDGVGVWSRSPSGAPADTHIIVIEPASNLSLSGLQTVPNPFAAGRESATFFYELSKAGQVTVRIMNLRGETVKAISQSGSFGTNSFEWNGILEDGSVASNGVYIYQVIARDIDGTSASARGKMIVLK